MQTRSMTSQMQTRSMTSQMQTRSMASQKQTPSQTSPVQCLALPKQKMLHYEWAKNNNLLFTLKQLEDMGLSRYDSPKVISDCFVYGCPNYHPQYYAVAPEGYYWKADIDEYNKEFKGYVSYEFYADAICQSFTLSKIPNYER